MGALFLLLLSFEMHFIFYSSFEDCIKKCILYLKFVLQLFFGVFGFCDISPISAIAVIQGLFQATIILIFGSIDFWC